MIHVIMICLFKIILQFSPWVLAYILMTMGQGELFISEKLMDLVYYCDVNTLSSEL